VNGPSHYAEAERLLIDAGTGADTGPVYYMDDQLPALLAAVAHATLALTAAAAALLTIDDDPAWQKATR
jgi:hypothetical protein